MKRDWGVGLFMAVLIILLVTAGIFLPSNTLTGNVVREETCAHGECFELCDYDEGLCSDEDMVCCFTEWKSGICDYEANCERIQEYSQYQSLEVYQDTVREPPVVVDASWSQFFLPLVAIALVVVFFVLRKKEHSWN